MIRRLALPIVLLALVSCGPNPTGPIATSITLFRLSADRLNLVSLGDTASVTGLILDAGGQEATGATIMWSSSDALIATVSGTGLVTAVANGSATVTAMSGSASATTSVTVAQAAVNLVLSDSMPTFATLTDTTQLTAAVTDASGSTISGLPRTAR